MVCLKREFLENLDWRQRLKMARGISPSVETREKVSRALKEHYRLNGHHNKGISLSRETRNKIGESVREHLRLNGHHNKGKSLSEERRRQISERSSIPTKYISEVVTGIASDYVFFDDSVDEILGNYNIPNGSQLSRLIRRAIGNGIITEDQYQQARSRRVSQATSGERNPNFNEWSRLQPYSPVFPKIMAPFIRERDGYACQSCGAGENGQAHDVHHIDYDKSNNGEENLISLCKGCHAVSNPVGKDRATWAELYNERIEQIYAGLSAERVAELGSYRERLIRESGLGEAA